MKIVFAFPIDLLELLDSDFLDFGSVLGLYLSLNLGLDQQNHQYVVEMYIYSRSDCNRLGRKIPVAVENPNVNVSLYDRRNGH